MAETLLKKELGFLGEITVRNPAAAPCPPTKNPAHPEPDLLHKLMAAAGS
jgi:hypothetical protein